MKQNLSLLIADPTNNGRGLDNDTDKDIKGLLPDNQPDSKSSQLGEVKPHVEGQVSSASKF